MKEVRELTILKLLYGRKGIKMSMELWKEFVRKRNEVGGRLREAREGGFRWGDLDI